MAPPILLPEKARDTMEEILHQWVTIDKSETRQILLWDSNGVSHLPIGAGLPAAIHQSISSDLAKWCEVMAGARISLKFGWSAHTNLQI